MELRAGSTPKGPTPWCVHTSAESLQDGKGGEPGSLPTPSQAGSLMLLHWRGGVSQLSPTGIKFPGDSVIERGTGSYAIRVDCPVPNSVLPPEKPACPAQSYLQGLSLPRDYVTLCLELQEIWEPPSDPSPARLRPKLSTPSMSTHAWLLYLQVSAPGLA